MNSLSSVTCNPVAAPRPIPGLPKDRQIAGRRSLHVTCGESRIGKSPVPLPTTVKAKLDGQNFAVEVFLDVCSPKYLWFAFGNTASSFIEPRA